MKPTRNFPPAFSRKDIMDYPVEVIKIAADAAAEHGDDIDAAVASAEASIRELPTFKQIVATLLHNAFRELIYDARHASNVKTRRDAGRYGGPGIVITGASPGIKDVYRSVYEYNIAGTQLGLLKGESLAGIADNESAIASGHMFNAELCRKLAKIVPDDKTVKEAVSEKKLNEMFVSLKRKMAA